MALTHATIYKLHDLAAGHTVDSAEALKIDLIERARENEWMNEFHGNKMNIKSFDLDCLQRDWFFWAHFCTWAAAAKIHKG